MDAGADVDSGPRYDCAQLNCDDGDACTVDTCSPDAGCAHVPRSGAFTLGVDLIELVSIEGGEVEHSLTALQDEVDVTECVVWSYAGRFATLDGNRLVAAPNHGARGTLSSTLGDTTISVPVHLKVVFVANSGGLSEDQLAEFDGTAEESDGVSLLYPYDGTVFPLDAKPPVLQWSGGEAGDTYQIRLRSTLFEFTDHVTAPAPSHYAVPPDMWKVLGASGLGKTDPVHVELLRHGKDGLTLAARQTWRIAQGHVNATVHYRELNGSCSDYPGNGRALAIQVGGEVVEVASQSACNGCHAITRDGTQMASSFDGGSLFAFATWDLRARSEDQPLSTYSLIADDVAGTFAAYNPTGDKLLFARDEAISGSSLWMYDFATQAVVGNDLLGTECSEPAWSPDGRLIAGICNMKPAGWAFDSPLGDLLIGDVAEDGVSIEDARTLVAQGSEDSRPSYPDFSPDSRYLVYSRTTRGSRSIYDGRVWLAAVDGSFNKPLMKLSSENREFYPKFAPRRAGGYYWVAFTTRRDYGHSAFAANDLKHVWVAAIDDSPVAEEDPSHPAFYLEGQRDCANAYELQFAPPICRPDGEACALGSDCCSGTCLAASEGAPRVCTTQPAGQCVLWENRCGEDAACCDGLTCVDNLCQRDD